jgi:predicted MFS family arabinose efflux permease
MGITQSWSGWLVWRFIAGVSSAWVLVSTSSLCLSRLAALGHPQRAGLVFSGVGCGIAAAGLLCMAMSVAAVPSSYAWLLLGFMALLGTLCARSLWAGATSPPSSAMAAAPDDSTSTSASTRWILICCYGLFGFGYILPATFLPAQARLLVEDPVLFGLAWPIFGLAAAASTVAVGRLAERFRRRHLWAGAQIIMAAGVLLPVVWPSLSAIALAAICIGGTFMVITMLGMQEAQAVAGPGGARRLMGALTASFAAGQLAGPIFFSLTHKYFAADLSFALTLAAAGLVLSSGLLLKKSAVAPF